MLPLALLHQRDISTLHLNDDAHRLDHQVIARPARGRDERVIDIPNVLRQS